MTSQTTISATSVFSALGLGLLVFAGACDTFDEGEEDEYLRSATVLDQLTGQQCRRVYWWAGYECYNSYDLTLNRDGTFVDSNAWEGTFEELDDDVIELDFGEKGITTLRATEQKNDKCWEPDPDAPVGGAGLISVCTGSQPFMRVKNYIDIFVRRSYIMPSANEYDHWAAAALTPPVDFQLRSVIYRLYSEYPPAPEDDPWKSCWAGLPHHVQVFISEGPTPDATPEVIEEFFVDLDDSSVGQFTYDEIELSLTAPLVVQAGTRVFVSVEMVNPEGAKLCIQTHTDTWLPEVNYWSSSATTPYPWAPLESFFWPSNTTRNYALDLVGIPLGPPS